MNGKTVLNPRRLVTVEQAATRNCTGMLQRREIKKIPPPLGLVISRARLVALTTWTDGSKTPLPLVS
jgi:hypothetical protein